MNVVIGTRATRDKISKYMILSNGDGVIKVNILRATLVIKTNRSNCKIYAEAWLKSMQCKEYR